ncbi:MAG: hypothetical protein A2X84_11805 [Desulfuromonadaceae bacterium GWC2_58_13]|nr:MAG: hypothetical protein A2X84_11805 [Desulfuromonadaceae bacterium GWC2_58_13]
MPETRNLYVPSETEPYMNPKQIRYFRRLLLLRRDEIARECRHSLSRLKEDKIPQPDLLDQCAAEAERYLFLVSEARRRLLIEQIDEALRRMEDGSYGYCEETGEEIGIRRLQIHPAAHLSVEAQELLENCSRGLGCGAH